MKHFSNKTSLSTRVKISRTKRGLCSANRNPLSFDYWSFEWCELKRAHSGKHKYIIPRRVIGWE